HACTDSDNRLFHEACVEGQRAVRQASRARHSASLFGISKFLLVDAWAGSDISGTRSESFCTEFRDVVFAEPAFLEFIAAAVFQIEASDLGVGCYRACHRLGGWSWR